MTGGLAVETRGDPELPGSGLQAPPDHGPVPRLEDEQGTGDAGKGRGAHEHGNSVVAGHGGRAARQFVLYELVTVGRRPGRVLLGCQPLEGAFHQLRDRLLTAGQVLKSHKKHTGLMMD